MSGTAYSELVKNFARVRAYMREFYVYGFKGREEVGQASARSYDDEKRRLESWLGDYMRFSQAPDGKKVFLSIDSRESRHNPLYAAWKAKSFTDGDITLHFILFDILYDPSVQMTLGEIAERVDEYLSGFSEPRTFDESTLRKKLKEYVGEGIITCEKRGKSVFYRRAADTPLPDGDILDYFSEAAPLGVIGSFLLDKREPAESHFAFKHHYITGAMDSEIVLSLLETIGEKRYADVVTIDRRGGGERIRRVLPLRILRSVQGGRDYLMAYIPRSGRVKSVRTDYILSVKAGEICAEFDEYLAVLEGMKEHLWGVSTQGTSGQRLERISFTVCYDPDEGHIHRRLMREKRCGKVEKLDANTSRFSVEVYDAGEMLTWVRTFICRITEFECSNPEVKARFLNDLQRMYACYGLEDGE